MADTLTLDMLEPQKGNLTDEQENVTLDSNEDESSSESEEGQVEGDAGEPIVNPIKPLYTPDELAYCMENDIPVDTDRLSVEGKALMKQFQRGYTKKFEAVAEERKRIEAEKVKASDPKEQLYSQYCENPNETISAINAEIERFAVIDSPETRQGIFRLQALKEELMGRRQSEIQHAQQADVIKATSAATISKLIPDFDTKQNALTEFAYGLGLSKEELVYLTDPGKVGQLAIKLTCIINAMYDRSNAGKTAEGKVKKTNPKPLAQTSASQEILTSPVDPSKMSFTQYKAWREGKKR